MYVQPFLIKNPCYTACEYIIKLIHQTDDYLAET